MCSIRKAVDNLLTYLIHYLAEKRMYCTDLTTAVHAHDSPWDLYVMSITKILKAVKNLTPV